MRNRVKAMLTLIGMVLIFIGAAIADSESGFPTIVLLILGVVFVSPVVIEEIKKEFT